MVRDGDGRRRVALQVDQVLAEGLAVEEARHDEARVVEEQRDVDVGRPADDVVHVLAVGAGEVDADRPKLELGEGRLHLLKRRLQQRVVEAALPCEADAALDEEKPQPGVSGGLDKTSSPARSGRRASGGGVGARQSATGPTGP